MSPSKQQIATLRRALFSDNRHERAQAAIQLGQNQDRDSVARLRDLASDPDDLVAIAAMFGAWQLDVDVVTIERMVAALSSDDEELVQESVFALCEMGEAMVPRLTALLDAHTADANAILRVLADIGGDKAFAAISILKSDNPDIASTIEELLDDWEE